MDGNSWYFYHTWVSAQVSTDMPHSREASEQEAGRTGMEPRHRWEPRQGCSRHICKKLLQACVELGMAAGLELDMGQRGHRLAKETSELGTGQERGSGIRVLIFLNKGSLGTLSLSFFFFFIFIGV